MLIKTSRNDRSPGIKSSEITSESVYLNRRQLLQAAGMSTAAGVLPSIAGAEDIPASYQRLSNVGKSSFSTSAPTTSFEDVIGYNNFYEFGTAKTDPVETVSFSPASCGLSKRRR